LSFHKKTIWVTDIRHDKTVKEKRTLTCWRLLTRKLAGFGYNANNSANINIQFSTIRI